MLLQLTRLLLLRCCKGASYYCPSPSIARGAITISEVGVTNRKSIPLNKGRIEADSEIQRAATAAMAEGRQEEEDYVIAFKSGNKLVAVQLLPRIPQPAAITTTFKFSYHGVLALVSLLHLAAYWGWRNVVTALVSVYKCAANCKDERGHIPLHYAAYNGHLEVEKYFVVQQLCGQEQYGLTPLNACINGHLNIARTSSERNTVIHHVRY